MRRRDLLAGVSLLGLGTARAQPSGSIGVQPQPGPSGVGLLAGPGPLPGPTLDLNFINGSALDSRITFTRASAASYFDASGTLQQAASNAPRFDYDPVTHALRGLLIEEARTNLVFPSIPATGANWAITGTLTPNSTTAPDSAVTASLLAASDTTASIRNTSYGASVAATTAPVTLSCFAKKAPASNAYIQVNNNGNAAAAIAYFDLTNGSAVVGADLVAGFTAKSATIMALPNGWYRCTLTLTPPSGTTALTPFFGPCTTVSATGDNRSYTGVVGQGVYLWGAQVEVGGFPTSYIPTTSAAATRSADVATLTSPAGYATAQASWAAQFILEGLTGGPRIIGDNATASGMIYIGAGFTVGVYDLVTSTNTANASSVGAVTKAASRISGANGSVCLNAGAVASAGGFTNGFGVVATTKLMGDSSTSDTASGWLQRVRYWPRALGNAEMQGATT